MTQRNSPYTVYEAINEDVASLKSLGARSAPLRKRVRWCEVFLTNLKELYAAALTVTSSNALAEDALLVALCRLKAEDQEIDSTAFLSAKKEVLRCSIAIARQNGNIEAQTSIGIVLQDLSVELRLAFTLRLLLRLSKKDARELLGISETLIEQLTLKACLTLSHLAIYEAEGHVLAFFGHAASRY